MKSNLKSKGNASRRATSRPPMFGHPGPTLPGWRSASTARSRSLRSRPHRGCALSVREPLFLLKSDFSRLRENARPLLRAGLSHSGEHSSVWGLQARRPVRLAQGLLASLESFPSIRVGSRSETEGRMRIRVGRSSVPAIAWMVSQSTPPRLGAADFLRGDTTATAPSTMPT